jgi:uncharacterized protein (DUF488 family)
MNRSRSASAIPIATIGYQATTVPAFLHSLTQEGVELLVDVRAVASSRRPGFSKTALAANLASVGIDYLHLRGLGTPADGRAAARAGRHAEMHAIFREHLGTEQAQAELETLAGIVRGGRRVCLLCYEADPAECHRTLVVEALRKDLNLAVTDLRPEMEED